MFKWDEYRNFSYLVVHRMCCRAGILVKNIKSDFSYNRSGPSIKLFDQLCKKKYQS